VVGALTGLRRQAGRAGEMCHQAETVLLAQKKYMYAKSIVLMAVKEAQTGPERKQTGAECALQGKTGPGLCSPRFTRGRTTRGVGEGEGIPLENRVPFGLASKSTLQFWTSQVGNTPPYTRQGGGVA
jgi:hypothetical protein